MDITHALAIIDQLEDAAERRLALFDLELLAELRAIIAAAPAAYAERPRISASA